MMQDEAARAERMSYGLRRAMVDNQVRTFDVTDQRLLEAMYAVPREKFLPGEFDTLAYSDASITLKTGQGDGRVLMPPMFLGKMIQNARVDATSRVLVVAGATGYAAALMAKLARSVVTLDSDPGFGEAARKALFGLGYGNVEVATGPMTEGHAAGAPYGVILVNGGVECNLGALFTQLAPGGCLVTIEARPGRESRRVGKATRFDNVGGEISPKMLFDATVPILPEFREKPAFVF